MERREVLHLLQIAMTTSGLFFFSMCIARDVRAAWPMIKHLFGQPEPAMMTVNFAVVRPLVIVITPYPLLTEEIALAA
jgi:hypothetical protein